MTPTDHHERSASHADHEAPREAASDHHEAARETEAAAAPPPPPAPESPDRAVREEEAAPHFPGLDRLPGLDRRQTAILYAAGLVPLRVGAFTLIAPPDDLPHMTRTLGAIAAAAGLSLNVSASADAPGSAIVVVTSKDEPRPLPLPPRAALVAALVAASLAAEVIAVALARPRAPVLGQALIGLGEVLCYEGRLSRLAERVADGARRMARGLAS